jgi:hypothetical protein
LQEAGYVPHESAVLVILPFRKLSGESLIRFDEVLCDPVWKPLDEVSIAATKDRESPHQVGVRGLEIRRKLRGTGEQHAAVNSRIVLLHGAVKPAAIFHIAADLHAGM